MAKDKYWIGDGVLCLKDGKSTISPGDKIPDGGISSDRMKTLSEAGWIGGPRLEAATPDLAGELADSRKALKASAQEVKKLATELGLLKDANNQLVETITELQNEKVEAK